MKTPSLRYISSIIAEISNIFHGLLKHAINLLIFSIHNCIPTHWSEVLLAYKKKNSQYKIVYKAIYRKWYRATLNKWWHCQQNNRMHRVDKICSLQNFWSSGNYSIVNRKRFENVTLLVSKKREKETMWCCGIISIPLSIHLFFAYHTCIKHSGCNFRFYTH